MQIQRLSSEVIDQIAAGEVLERPAHLIKELVENAIDAGASEIEIQVGEGGRFVQIQDNGHGISKEELALALERHATSKIQKASDLWDLHTYGFRGEALASIAAVTRLTLISRVAGSESAYEIQSNFGKLSPVAAAAGNFGTFLRIEELFGNVPARLKFLKSESAELTQIKKILKAMAMTYPMVHFILKTDGRLIGNWAPQKSWKARIENILEIKELFESEEDYGSVKVHAVFSSPNDVQKSSQNIWVYVQNRYVQDKTVQAAVLAAYESLLMHGEFPIAAVWVTCDPQEVDVNIHPTKSQVRFRDPAVVFRSVRDTLRKVLATAPWRKHVAFAASSMEILEPGPKENITFGFADFEATRFPQKQMPAASAENADPLAAKQNILDVLAQYAPMQKQELVTPAEAWEAKPYWSLLQVLGQLNLTYILAQSSKSLVLIDQHASHERVAYERLMKAWRGGEIEVQSFLFPFEVEIEDSLVDSILNVSSDLKKLGFTLGKSINGKLEVLAAPALLKDKSFLPTFEKLGLELSEKGDSSAVEKKISDLCATMACHSVVRAGQALSIEEMQALLQQMDEFPLSSFCPHGRPVYVEYTFAQLDKSFGRIV